VHKLKSAAIGGIVSGILTLTATAADLGPDKDMPVSRDMPFDQSGMLLCQCQSALGQRFFETFSKAWALQPNSLPVDMTVAESYGPKASRQVRITVGPRQLFAQSLPPKDPLLLDRLARDAADVVASRLLGNNLQKLMN